MDLIQIMKQLPNQNWYDQSMNLRNVQSQIQRQGNWRIQNNNRQFKVNTLLDKKQNISIAVDIIINKQAGSINIKYFLFDNMLFKMKTHHQKILNLRVILKLMQNRPFFHIKCNPVTGFIFIQSLNSLKTQSNLLEQIFNIYLQINQQLLFQNITNLLKIINFFNQSKNQQISNKSLQNLSLIKSYITYSNYYTWFALKNSTKNVKRSDNYIVYDESKKQFSLMEKNLTENTFIQALSAIYYKKSQNKSIQLLNQEQDRFLCKKYLQKSFLTSKNSNQITEINVAKQVLQNIQKDIDIQINCHELKGGIYVRIQKAKPQNIQFYQNLILESLPNKEFLNLVKFYKIKDNKQFNKKWEITNLYHSHPLDKFLKSNQTTISIFTKISILNQISNGLKYFRDLNSVYHNLLPKNLFLKKGLMLKLTDLSNVYKYNVNNAYFSNKAFKQIPYNKFPYVFNLRNSKQSSMDDQRSDIYSYGVLLYEILLNKPYLNIKQSKIKDLTDLQKIKLIQKTRISIKEAINQSNDELLVLFTYFSMKCSNIDIGFNQINLNELQEDQNQYNDYDQQQNNEYQLRLQERPYLDWVVIITKDFYSCYQKYLI